MTNAMLGMTIVLAALLPMQDRNTGLFEAISAGDAAAVKKALHAGADPNARTRTYPALVVAFFANRPQTADVIAALLKAGADPSAAGSDTKAAVQLAAERPQADLLDVFLEHGVSPDWRNRNGESLLAVAAALGHTAVARRLVDKGANLNTQDDEGFTALMNACQNRHLDVVRLLVDKGADRTIKNKYGQTAAALVQGKHDDTQAGKLRRQIAALLE